MYDISPRRNFLFYKILSRPNSSSKKSPSQLVFMMLLLVSNNVTAASLENPYFTTSHDLVAVGKSPTFWTKRYPGKLSHHLRKLDNDPPAAAASAHHTWIWASSSNFIIRGIVLMVYIAIATLCCGGVTKSHAIMGMRYPIRRLVGVAY